VIASGAIAEGRTSVKFIKRPATRLLDAVAARARRVSAHRVSARRVSARQG
jgi:hypothetical protein